MSLSMNVHQDLEIRGVEPARAGKICGFCLTGLTVGVKNKTSQTPKVKVPC